MHRRRCAALAALTIGIWGCSASEPEPTLPVAFPPTLEAAIDTATRGLDVQKTVQTPEPVHPTDNPPSAEKAMLGKRLFHETRLSVTGAFSCASCHQPHRHFTDGLPVARGATGALHDRHTPTLYHAAFQASYGWRDDGITTLEAQHLIPLLNTEPVELGFTERNLDALRADASYRRAFAESFGCEAVTLDRVVKALATYVRTLRPPVSAFDRYVFGDETDAITAEARTGMTLFFSPRLGCATCHAGFSLSGPLRHSGHRAEPVFHVTGVGGARTAFRAPTLRAIRFTAPYMHDGSIPTLDAVLDHYEHNPAPRVPDFELSARERSALLAFLNTL